MLSLFSVLTQVPGALCQNSNCETVAIIMAVFVFWNRPLQLNINIYRTERLFAIPTSSLKVLWHCIHFQDPHHTSTHVMKVLQRNSESWHEGLRWFICSVAWWCLWTSNNGGIYNVSSSLHLGPVCHFSLPHILSNQGFITVRVYNGFYYHHQLSSMKWRICIEYQYV